MNNRQGIVVKLSVPLLGNEMDSLGVVIQDYTSGILILFKNGEIDGFSNEEIDRFLEPVGFSPKCVDYTFTSVLRAYEAYLNGFFDDVLKYKEGIYEHIKNSGKESS